MNQSACSFVIFGATGNLSKLKLIPGFYHLEMEGKLPEATKIVAIGPRPWDSQQWLSEVRTMLQERSQQPLDESVFARFSHRLHYHRGNIDELNCYQQLAITLGNSDQFPQNMAFYLAIGPDDFGPVIESLS